MIFIEYPKCTTCQKAKKWLDENGFDYESRHIKENHPNTEEIKGWIESSGITARKFFNTSGILYREMKLKERLENMTEDEQIEILASDGMLVKRPLLINDSVILIGFNEKKWTEALK